MNDIIKMVKNIYMRTWVIIILIVILLLKIRLEIRFAVNKNIIVSFKCLRIIRIYKKINKQNNFAKIIRKYSLNKEKEKKKLFKMKSLINKVLPSITLNNLIINIQTYSEYTYLSFLMLDSYIRNILMDRFLKVGNYRLNYVYSDETSYLIHFDFSFRLYYVIYMLIKKNNFRKGVINGKSSKRNNEIVFR